MALRASEILLILRAKNQASMTIRRVAKDVTFLGRTIKANQAGFDMLGKGRRAAVQGAAMTHVGGAASLAGGATLLGLGAASKSFAEFDKMASLASSQIDTVDDSVMAVVENTARLRDEILGMMGDFPATAQEMSNAAFEIFSSADVGFERGIGLMKLFNQTAVAGMTDLETATNGAMTVINNFGDPAGPIGKSKDLMNDMFSIIRYGRIDLETLNTMMNQIAPAAAAADQKLSDVGGAIAALTRRLGPGIASAGLARLFEIFQRKDFQAGMAKAGASITDLQGKLLPLPQIMQKIMSLGPKPGKTLQNLIQTVTAFGAGKGQGVQATVQARRALVTLIKNYEDYVDIQGRSMVNNDQFFKQLASQQQSFGVRWDKFTNKLRAQVLMIGEDAIPVFEDMGAAIGPVLDAWMELDSGTKATIVSTTAAVAAFTLLGGLLTSFAGIVRGLYGLLLMTSAVIKGKLIPSMIAWGSTMMMPGGPAYAARSLLGSLRGILGLGAITVGMTLAFKGDGWTSYIGAALAGAGAAAMLGAGPMGIVLGAVTVPVVLMLKNDVDNILDIFSGNKRNRWSNMSTSGLKQAARTWASEYSDEIDAELERRARNRPSAIPAGTTAEQVAAGRFKIPNIGEDVARGINAGTKKVNDATKKGLFSNVKTMDQLNAAVEAQLKEGNKKMEQLMDERANVIERAIEEQQQVLDGAISNLESTYDSFLQANQQAMGELMSGPWLTSETFNLAEEWGITPAIQDLNRDLREQIKAFTDWQSSLKAIGARGAPRELLQSLEALGPDAVDKLEVLRKASPKMFNEFIRLWQRRQTAIKNETKIDFNAQLKEWNKYGKDIAFEIIAGLRSENVQLQEGFSRYITDNFSGALADIKEQALAEFYRENPEARTAKANAAAQAKRVRTAAEKRRDEMLKQQGDTFHVYQQPGETDAAFAKRIAWARDKRKGKGKVAPSKKTSAAKRPETVRGGN